MFKVVGLFGILGFTQKPTFWCARKVLVGDISVISEKDILFISVDLLRGDIYKNTVNVYTPKIFSISAPSGEDRDCRAP